MSYPNVGDYKGRTGLSPPAAYPSTVEYGANEDNQQSRHHVYTTDYYSDAGQVPALQDPSTGVFAPGDEQRTRK